MSGEQQYIFGFRPCMEAVQAGLDIERIYLRRGMQGDLFQEMFHLIREAGIPYQFVPIEKLNRISRKNHQGVIAVKSAITYQPLEEVITGLYESGKDPLILVLDGITDVRNLGALARSAEGAGVHAILIPERGSAQINPDAIKTSSGALNMLPVARTPDLLKSVWYLKEAGLRIVGATEKSDHIYYEQDLAGPIALVMGAEDKGISPAILKICDQSLAIPLAGKVGSLNVSVAAGIILFEVLKQRLAQK